MAKFKVGDRVETAFPPSFVPQTGTVSSPSVMYPHSWIINLDSCTKLIAKESEMRLLTSAKPQPTVFQLNDVVRVVDVGEPHYNGQGEVAGTAFNPDGSQSSISVEFKAHGYQMYEHYTPCQLVLISRTKPSGAKFSLGEKVIIKGGHSEGTVTNVMMTKGGTYEYEILFNTFTKAFRECDLDLAHAAKPVKYTPGDRIIYGRLPGEVVAVRTGGYYDISMDAGMLYTLIPQCQLQSEKPQGIQSLAAIEYLQGTDVHTWYGDLDDTPQCECGKDKHGFASHTTWCALYDRS